MGAMLGAAGRERAANIGEVDTTEARAIDAVGTAVTPVGAAVTPKGMSNLRLQNNNLPPPEPVRDAVEMSQRDPPSPGRAAAGRRGHALRLNLSIGAAGGKACKVGGAVLRPTGRRSGRR